MSFEWRWWSGSRIGFLLANSADVLEDLGEAADVGDGFGLRKFRLDGCDLFAYYLVDDYGALIIIKEFD